MCRSLVDSSSFFILTLFYKMDRRRGQNRKMIWLMTKAFRWKRVDVPLHAIAAAGGGHGDMTLMGVFGTMDRGITTMKEWCERETKHTWHFEPGNVFLFKNTTDATLFKMQFS